MKTNGITLPSIQNCLWNYFIVFWETIAFGDGFPEESTNGTDVPLIRPPYRGRIKPPALRVVVDFRTIKESPDSPDQ
jgi:hypothetical protein